MKTLPGLSLLMMMVVLSTTAIAKDPQYQPFIVASTGLGSLAEKTQSTREALEGAGFEVAGQYSPVDGTGETRDRRIGPSDGWRR